MIYACMLNSGVGVINPFGEDLHTSRRLLRLFRRSYPDRRFG
jgi:hypothetical protein